MASHKSFPATQADVDCVSVRVTRLERALRRMYDLHTCDSVKAPPEPCPICSAYSVIADDE